MTTALYVQIALAFIGLLSTVVIAVFGFLMSRTLKQIDENQQELFSRMHEAERDLYVLKGEHARNHLADMKVNRGSV